MPRPGARAEQQIATFTEEMRTALGEELVCLVLHGSAAGDEWVVGHSDINTALVVPRVTLGSSSAWPRSSPAGASAASRCPS